MAYAAGDFSVDHVLIQWGGKLPGNEEWSCSIRCAEQSSVGGVQVPPQAEVESWLSGAIKDAVLAYHTRPTSMISAMVDLSFVKANRIGVNGLYMDQSTNEYVFADVPGTGSGSAYMPPQCTIAVSLTTGYSRGPAHRGRFYLPIPSVTIDPNLGVISATEAATIAGSTKTFIEALADVPGIDSPVSLTPCVMSRKSGAAAHRPITGVEVGRVIDTQRRRRKSLVENYQANTLDTGTY